MFKDNLRAIRKDFNITQKQIADRLEISDARYNQYETGKRMPDSETMKKLSSFFGVPIDYLLSNGVFENWDDISENWADIASYLDNISKCLPKPHCFEYEYLVCLDLLDKIKAVNVLFEKIEIDTDKEEIRVHWLEHDYPKNKILNITPKETDKATDKLTPSEQTHLKKYRAMDERGKQIIDNLLDLEYQYILNKKDDTKPKPRQSPNV